MLQQGCFSVPWHQRYYDWDVSHVEMLLNDIDEATEAKRSCHFLGSIMLIKQGDRRWEINDGQQRIITFSLICACLCRIGNNSGDKRIVDKMLQILFDIDSMHNKTMHDLEELSPRVDPPEFNKDNFNFIIRGYEIKANGKMTIAWDKIFEFFNDRKHHKEKWLEQITDFILEKILIVQLEIDKTLDANAIFEVLNYRGKKLEDVDLIKNHIFSFFSHGDDNEIRKTVQRNLERVYTGFRDVKVVSFYVRCYLQIKFGYLHSSQGNFFQEVKKYISINSNNHSIKKSVLDLVDELAAKHRVQLFHTLLRPSTNSEGLDQLTKHSGSTNSKRNIKNFLADLHQYKITYPIQLSLLCKYWESPDNEKKISARFVYHCYKYLAAFMQRVAHTQGNFKPSLYEEKMANLAQNISQGKCETKDQFLAEIRTFDYADIIPDRNYIEQMEIIKYRSTTKAKYILARIVEDEQKDIAISDTQASIEHILPKGDSHHKAGGWSEFDKNSRANYIHRLGNFTLLHKRDNKPQERHNKNFIVKQLVFETCSYDITNRLNKLCEWTPESIEKRQIEFAKTAAEIWNFD